MAVWVLWSCEWRRNTIGWLDSSRQTSTAKPGAWARLRWEALAPVRVKVISGMGHLPQHGQRGQQLHGFAARGLDVAADGVPARQAAAVGSFQRSQGSGFFGGGVGGRNAALWLGHCLGSFMRLKGHRLRFEAQQVGGMFKTWIKPCAGRY